MLPTSDLQAIAEINESLGLGLDKYLAQRKVAMQNAPLTYLTDCNMPLGGVIAKRGRQYARELAEINNLLPAAQRDTPVWQMATDVTRLKGWLT